MCKPFEPQRCGFFLCASSGNAERNRAAALQDATVRVDLVNVPTRSSVAVLRNPGDLLDKAAEPTRNRFPPTRNAPDLVASRFFPTRSRSCRYPESRRPA